MECYGLGDGIKIINDKEEKEVEKSPDFPRGQRPTSPNQEVQKEEEGKGKKKVEELNKIYGEKSKALHKGEEKEEKILKDRNKKVQGQKSGKGIKRNTEEKVVNIEREKKRNTEEKVVNIEREKKRDLGAKKRNVLLGMARFEAEENEKKRQIEEQKQKDKEKEFERQREREKEQELGRQRERELEKEREREREREKERAKEKEKERVKEREKERERERERERTMLLELEKEKEKEKEFERKRKLEQEKQFQNELDMLRFHNQQEEAKQAASLKTTQRDKQSEAPPFQVINAYQQRQTDINIPRIAPSPFTDQEINEAFHTFDLDRNGYLSGIINIYKLYS